MDESQESNRDVSDNSVSKEVAKTWDGFASSSTVHGMRFLSPGFSTQRRVSWGVLIIAFFFVLIGSLTSTVVEYFQFEVNTIVTMVSEREAKFPAVTICNLNSLRRSKFKRASKDKKYSEILRLAKILSLDDFDHASDNVTVPYFSGSRVRDMYQYFGHMMDRFEKDGMLLNCTYSQAQCDESHFKSALTDLGLCFTFNPGGSFGTQRYGKQVLTVTQPGNGFGLSIRLNAQTEDYILMPYHEFSAGWKVFVHDQSELPLAKDYGFAVSPGTHTFVGLIKRKVYSNMHLFVNIKSTVPSITIFGE